MSEIKCPKCGSVFKIDEENYDSIVKQVRDSEFNREIENREKQYHKDKEATIKIVTNDVEKKFNEQLVAKDLEIANLKNKIDNNKINQDNAVKQASMDVEKKLNDTINTLKLQITNLENELKIKDTENNLKVEELRMTKDKDIGELTNKIEVNKREFELKKQLLKDGYESKLKSARIYSGADCGGSRYQRSCRSHSCGNPVPWGSVSLPFAYPFRFAGAGSCKSTSAAISHTMPATPNPSIFCPNNTSPNSAAATGSKVAAMDARLAGMVFSAAVYSHCAAKEHTSPNPRLAASTPGVVRI